MSIILHEKCCPFIQYTKMINKLSTSFPGDLKWSVYISEIVNSACKKLGLLKKLKFSFDRDKLLKINKTKF